MQILNAYGALQAGQPLEAQPTRAQLGDSPAKTNKTSPKDDATKKMDEAKRAAAANATDAPVCLDENLQRCPLCRAAREDPDEQPLPEFAAE